MPTPLLGLTRENITGTVLVVFGETVDNIKYIIKNHQIELLSKSREFKSFSVQISKQRILYINAGIGSASVECVLSELAMLGAKNIVLAGTCGASKHYKLGQAYILSEAELGNNGSTAYYSDDKTDFSYPSKMLLDIAKKSNLKEAKIISSDAFYGFGCILKDGKPAYAGPELSVKTQPPGFEKFKSLYLSNRPYLIDMETAFFYRLCGLFGMDGIAVKGVSNHIPFEKEIIKAEKEALESSVQESVKLIMNIQGVS